MAQDDDTFLADRMLILDASVGFLRRHRMEHSVDDVISVAIFLSGDAMPPDLSSLRGSVVDDDDVEDDTEEEDEPETSEGDASE